MNKQIIDPVTFSIVMKGLISASQEMTMNLLRAAYSTIIREASDASAAIMDVDGHVVAQADDMPIHLNSFSTAFEGIAQKHDVMKIRENEIFITNDPYNGAQHLPDIFIFSPIFFENRLVAFAGSVGHHLDIGGAGAGSIYVGAKDIFAEGIRLPRIKFEVGKNLEDTLVGDIIRANIRVPRETFGDLNAQLAANRTGACRVCELFKKYGADMVLACMKEICSYSEQLTREAILRLPDGDYTGQDVLDDDGVGNGPFKIVANVHISGDSLSVDFEGTDQQAKGPVNCPVAATKSAVFTALKCVLTGSSVPANYGCNLPIEIRIPQGCILNPNPPAPVRARINTCLRAFYSVIKALATIAPDRTIATCLDSNILGFNYRENDHFVVFNEPVRGGYGAGIGTDGACQCATPLDNCTNTPVEAAESEYGAFLIRSYEFDQDTQGFGEFCGAPGITREYEILRDEVNFSLFTDRHKHRPAGLNGGLPGKAGKLVLVRDGVSTQLPSKGEITLKKGDRIKVSVGGGGGYGDPRKRNIEVLKSDIRKGRISLKAAAEVFGYMPDRTEEV